MELEWRIRKGVKWNQEYIKECIRTYILQSKLTSYTLSWCKLVCHWRCLAPRRKTHCILFNSFKWEIENEKEALAMKHGCQKFYQHIYGTDMIIEMNHRLLESILKKTNWSNSSKTLKNHFRNSTICSKSMLYTWHGNVHSWFIEQRLSQ